jgi:UDP-N-acetyl-D-mannosaminuronic acid transferase (WecB/TagA/CpsF family)
MACLFNQPEAIVWHMEVRSIKGYAGTKKRAPEWMSGIGIEWIHRFIYERNTRMSICYIIPLFVIIISLQLLKNLLRRIKEL